MVNLPRFKKRMEDFLSEEDGKMIKSKAVMLGAISASILMESVSARRRWVHTVESAKVRSGSIYFKHSTHLSHSTHASHGSHGNW